VDLGFYGLGNWRLVVFIKNSVDADGLDVFGVEKKL
jgi:hypothetical protein